MNRFAFVTDAPTAAARIAAVLGDNWQSVYRLIEDDPGRGENPRPRKSFSSGTRYVLFEENSTGLTQIYLFDSRIAYEVKMRPLDFTYTFRDSLAKPATAIEMKRRLEVLLELWRDKLRLDLTRPLGFFHPPTRDDLTLNYLGWEIRRKKGGQDVDASELWLKFREIGEKRELEFPLCYFYGTYMEIVPTRKPFEQPTLFG